MIASSSKPRKSAGRTSRYSRLSGNRHASRSDNMNVSPPSSPRSNALSHDALSRRPLSPVSPIKQSFVAGVLGSVDLGSSDKSSFVLAARSSDQQENEPFVSPHVFENELLMSVSNLVEFFRSDDDEEGSSSAVPLHHRHEAGARKERGCPLEIAECVSGSSLLGYAKNKDGSTLLDEETMYNVSLFINMLQRTDAELAQELDEVVKSLSSDSRDMESLVMKPETRVALETYIDVVSGKKGKGEIPHGLTASGTDDHRPAGRAGSFSSTSLKKGFKASVRAKKQHSLSKSFSTGLSLNDSGIDLVRSKGSSISKQNSAEFPPVEAGAEHETNLFTSDVFSSYLGHLVNSVAGSPSPRHSQQSDLEDPAHLKRKGVEGSLKNNCSALNPTHSRNISPPRSESDFVHLSKFVDKDGGSPNFLNDYRSGFMQQDSRGAVQGVYSLTDIRSLETASSDPVHRIILPNNSGIGLARSSYEEEEQEGIDQIPSFLYPNATEDTREEIATASTTDDKTNPDVQRTETFMSNDLGTEALSILGHFIDAVARSREETLASTLPDPIPQTSSNEELAISYEDQSHIKAHDGEGTENDPVVELETIGSVSHGMCSSEADHSETSTSLPPAAAAVKAAMLEAAKAERLQKRDPPVLSECPLETERNDPPSVASPRSLEVDTEGEKNPLKANSLTSVPTSKRDDPEESTVPGPEASRGHDLEHQQHKLPECDRSVKSTKNNATAVEPTSTTSVRDPEASHEPPLVDMTGELNHRVLNPSLEVLTTEEFDTPQLHESFLEVTSQTSEPSFMDTPVLCRQMSEPPFVNPAVAELYPRVCRSASQVSLSDTEDKVHSQVTGQSSGGSIKIIFFETTPVSRGKKRSTKSATTKDKTIGTKGQTDSAYHAHSNHTISSKGPPSGSGSGTRRTLFPPKPQESGVSPQNFTVECTEQISPLTPECALTPTAFAAGNENPDPTGAIEASESIEHVGVPHVASQTEPTTTDGSVPNTDGENAIESSSFDPRPTIEPNPAVELDLAVELDPAVEPPHATKLVSTDEVASSAENASIVDLTSYNDPIDIAEAMPMTEVNHEGEPTSEVDSISPIDPLKPTAADPNQHSVPTALELIVESHTPSLDITRGGGPEQILSIGTLPKDDTVETVVLTSEDPESTSAPSTTATSSAPSKKDLKRAKLADEDPLETLKRLWAVFPNQENKPKRGRHKQDAKQDELFEKFVALVDISFPFFDGKFPHVVDKARLQVQARRQEIPIFVTATLMDMLYSLPERELALDLTPLPKSIRDLSKSEFASVRKEALLRRLANVREAERRRDVMIYSTACSNDEEAVEIDMTGEFQFTLKDYAGSDSSDDEEPWYQSAAKLTKVLERSRDSDDLDTRSTSKEFLSESGSWGRDKAEGLVLSLEEEIDGFWVNQKKRRPNYFPLRQRGVRLPSISSSFSGTDNDGSYGTGTTTSSFSSLARYDPDAEEELWIRKRDMALWRKSPVGSSWLGGGRSTNRVRDPEPINAVHATVYFVRPGFMKRRCNPGTSQWYQPYDPRIASHNGYFDVNVQSLYESTNIHGCKHPQDLLPWERREVKQRFLHEQSISYNRNWFGTTKKVYGNDRLRQPVCRPKSMEMPMKAGEWTEEWYKKPWARLSQCPSLSAADADLREIAQIRRRYKIGEEFEDTFSWEETPECGTFRNVKLKIGERISRVTPDLTSSLRRSRWRKKYFPKGTFPY